MTRILLILIGTLLFTTPALGAKGRIAVGTIEYSASGTSQSGTYSAYSTAARKGTEAFKEMLTTALTKTAKFDVVELETVIRAYKGQRLSEQQFLAMLHQGKGTKLKGIDYIATASITEFAETLKTNNAILFTTQSQIGTMAVDIKIIDVRDGSIVVAETVQARVKGKSALKVAKYRDALDKQSGLLGTAMRHCAQRSANLTVTTIYPIKVVAKTDDGQVMLNYGSSLLSNGMQLAVFSQGEKFRDPDTGEILGCEEELIGIIQVTATQPKYSKAKIVTPNGSIKKGMVARVVQQTKQVASKSK